MAFLVTGFFSLWFGPRGIAALDQLKNYDFVLEENLRRFENTNRDLRRRLEALRSDAATLELAARELGYYGPSESVLRIRGQIAAPLRDPEQKLLRMPIPNTWTEDGLRLIFVVALLAIFGLLEWAALLKSGVRSFVQE